MLVDGSVATTTSRLYRPASFKQFAAQTCINMNGQALNRDPVCCCGYVGMTSDCISLYILYWPAAALISLSGVLDLDVALHPLLSYYPLLSITNWHTFVVVGRTCHDRGCAYNKSCLCQQLKYDKLDVDSHVPICRQPRAYTIQPMIRVGTAGPVAPNSLYTFR